MTDSEIVELLQMQLKTQQQQNEFLQKKIESLNQNIQSQTDIISRKSGQKIQKIANLQYYKSKANYGTKKKGISR